MILAASGSAPPLIYLFNQLIQFLLLLGIIANLVFWPRYFQDVAGRAVADQRVIWRPWNLRIVGNGMLVLFALGMPMVGLSGWLFGGQEAAWAELPTVEMLASGILFNVVGLIWVVWMLRRWRTGWRVGLDGPLGWFDCLAQGGFFYVLVMPLLHGVSVWSARFLRWIGDPPEPQQFFTRLGESLVQEQGVPLLVVAGFALMSVVLAPVFEECLFRGMLFPALLKQMRVLPAMLLMSGVFALVHQNMGAFTSLFVLALVLHVAFVHTGSIRVAIVIHALHNLDNFLRFVAMQHLN